MSVAAAIEPAGPGADERGRRHRQLLEVICRAAHLLPTQGPITVFVHHNTLHALEELSFDEALVQSVDVYGCEPYLSEERYRQEYARGRIAVADLIAALEHDLGDRTDELIGFLGTRFHFRLAMLQYPLRTAPNAELRWIIAETEALRKFRADAPAKIRQRLIEETRRWVMRDFRENASGSAASQNPRHEVLAELIRGFSPRNMEQWNASEWEAFTLQLLWRICSVAAHDVRPAALRPAPPQRHRDLLLAAAGDDPDVLVHGVLIRFASAFLDQGFAAWRLPHHDEGFFGAFVDLYGEPGGVLPRWMSSVSGALARWREAGVEPLDAIEESLAILGVDEADREAYLTRTLLALEGWAGMIWQMETNAEWAVRPAPRGTLVGFLAVRLLLDRIAAEHVAREQLDYRGPMSELRATLARRAPASPSDAAVGRAFMAFQFAQVLGWRPEDLNRLPAETWQLLRNEVNSFSELDRRRVFHSAYELHYRNQALDCLAAHARRGHGRVEPDQATERAAFQLICCIDEREESFRRHVEEISPRVETFSAPGFFAVAMYYRGAADAHYIPLCPVVIRPQHYVCESAAYSFERVDRRRAETRRVLGRLTHRAHVGSRTLLGGALAALTGSLASIPLVARVLFPRFAAKFRQKFGSLVQTPPISQLQLERTETEPGSTEGRIGFSIAEMARAVARVLGDCGLMDRFSPLVIVMGHGSSSLNNPHEAAHDCGACGGARGGPNARAFAEMANDPRVRAILRQKGFSIPDETVFVGAYHNTCDDAVVYFDLERLPTWRRRDFDQAKRALDQARMRNAHERCRRFESAPLDISPEAALRHVEARAEDLAQVRPEYGHATNAMCVVGRRSRTRGLYLDRRAFLNSYDPTVDDEAGTILTRILQAAIPVCGGISLEYYFSVVDPVGYGCGTKLPHNITALLGVMDGAASDLRPGLPWQMVEIHEAMRILFVVETTPEMLLRIIDADATIGRLCRNKWVQLATLAPDSADIHVFDGQRFVPYPAGAGQLNEVSASVDWYRGWRDHLDFALIGAQSAAARLDEAFPPNDEAHT